MAMSSRIVALGAFALLLGGCATSYHNIGEEDPALGEAVRYNAAIQTINPAPVYAANAAQPGSHGEKGQKAVERYRKDQVKQPQVYQTTGSSGSGSSSASTPH
jgi:hypothetical protein